jgi:hypothetical protein
MSENKNKPQSKHVPHRTNSPPLEATGEDKPMGASCIAGTQQAGHVSDAEQRRGEIEILGLIPRNKCLLIPISFIRLFPRIGE